MELLLAIAFCATPLIATGLALNLSANLAPQQMQQIRSHRHHFSNRRLPVEVCLQPPRPRRRWA
ncbi:MAG: hypothetical protein ERJ67_09170 [Aphanocapsa feldmannii 277cV]|uniref:Uncharacterized protein n=2 Tax=Aphanocapsa feldmannii TaxID=192050 RepID=A0A524RMH3_9CHRO|nr:MAG: hypothetical protein ERJ69_07450 [Aphanocapsa feldmannii 288cV]TGG90883.1 MAG: hypothetical protein ERJ67_09170 [Aphanocapsa feldmannii 277cV]TGH21309.1 MAG: hypothetical protein ERJ68_05710 [Aphanocapsa feldmannii 277cI]